MRFIPLCGGILSFVALLLLAVGTATDHWINLTGTKGINGPIVNTELVDSNALALDVTTRITYHTKHYGLWIGCYLEQANQVKSCAYVNTQCKTYVCWIREEKNRVGTCMQNRVMPLTNCTAYQFVRAFVVIGVILMVLGTSTQLVSLMTFNRTLAAIAGLVVFLAGFCVMIGFSIFYNEEYATNGAREIGGVGYSLILIAFAWPAMMLSGVLSCCSASIGIRTRMKSDYSASNF